MRIRNVLLPLIGVLAGAALGFGSGYFYVVAGTVSQMPFFYPSRSKSVPLEQELDDFSRLGAMEYLAACGDNNSVSRALDSETEILRGMQQPGKSEVIPLVRVAQARLIVRKGIAAEQNPTSNSQSGVLKQDTATVETLLKEAGWNDPSEGRLRKVIQAVDGEQCRK